MVQGLKLMSAKFEGALSKFLSLKGHLGGFNKVRMTAMTKQEKPHLLFHALYT